MAHIFYKKQNTDIPVNNNDTIHFLGYSLQHQPDSKIQAIIDKECIELNKVLVPQAVYEEYELTIEDNRIIFAGKEIVSKDLSRNLSRCSRIIVLASTVGSRVDMSIRKMLQIDTARASIDQAVGAMYIESFLNGLNDQIRNEALLRGYKAHPRFSPGYGDVKLEVQKMIFDLLPCRKIGLTLMDTLIMAPEKSVTCFIGLEKL